VQQLGREGALRGRAQVEVVALRTQLAALHARPAQGQGEGQG